MKKKRLLYLGLDPSRYPVLESEELVYYPLIDIQPIPFHSESVQKALQAFPLSTHLLFTSRSGVKIFLNYLKRAGLSIEGKTVIAVGKATAELLQEANCLLVAEEESSEGVIDLLQRLPLKGAHLFWPHSAGSRPLIGAFLSRSKVVFDEFVLYHTLAIETPFPELETIDAIIFTSPSTVDAFCSLHGKSAAKKELRAIGKITEQYMKDCFIINI